MLALVPKFPGSKGVCRKAPVTDVTAEGTHSGHWTLLRGKKKKVAVAVAVAVAAAAAAAGGGVVVVV